ncbi:hypothetical protein D3C75_547920 [compost metagenome]
MKASDVLKDQVKWLKERCKAIKKEIDRNNVNKSMWYEDYYGDKLQSQLDECVSIKISTEKYMKKLRYEGN